ncbi:MAG: hypothetical protein GYB68_12255 [Chloroflexi bacterium]|nr:hypothetical protein [Chloroflexota bacterium]
MQCPRCQNPRMTWEWETNQWHCPSCETVLAGHERQAAPKPLKRLSIQRASQPQDAQQEPLQIEPPSRFDYSQVMPGDPILRSLRLRGDMVLSALAMGDLTSARNNLRLMADLSNNVPEVWLSLAALSDDAATQRGYLEHYLALNMHDAAVIRLLAKLDGKLDDKGPDPASSLPAGQVEGAVINCPNCGGKLTLDIQAGQVNCYHCNYLILDVAALVRQSESLSISIGLARRQDAQAWQIGERVLHCSTCGAHTTITQRRLTSECQFCGSRSIVQEAVDQRFEQPDLIAAFRLSEDQVRDRVLDFWNQRPAERGLFARRNPEVRRLDVWGVYLPFWLFEAHMRIQWRWTRIAYSGENYVHLDDVLHFAASTPPRKFVESIEPFDLKAAVDYDPRLLAEYPAELYDVDVDQAAIDVRDWLQELTIKRMEPNLKLSARPPAHLRQQEGSAGRLQMNATTASQSYQLILLPVWLITLDDQAGRRSRGVVNGQTGEIGLSRPVELDQ